MRDETVLIEQAIFTSAETARAQGYQLVSRSAGLGESEARELAIWGPSHDSLLERPGERASTNFHRLSSGNFCVSRTVLAGAEYSGRGGDVVYTHFLVVPPPVLRRFSNNPFALVRAALAIGALEPRVQPPEILESLSLGGRSAAVDMSLIAQLARDPGPAALATLIQAALASDHLAVAAAAPSDQLIAGLINLLPIECRCDFTFSTGLKCCSGRPVRVSSLPDDPASWRTTARCGVTLLDLNEAQLSDELSWKGWAGCVARLLRAGKLSLLSSALEQSRPWLSCVNLNLLSKQVETDFESGSRAGAARDAMVDQELVAAEAGTPRAAAQHRGDPAHLHGEAAAAQSPAERTIDKLAEALAGQPPEILELLERIDDLVFTAISGNGRALEELEVLWPTVAGELDANLVEQSREQYLRCALSICSDNAEGNNRKPERAAAAIEVLCVLFDA